MCSRSPILELHCLILHLAVFQEACRRFPLHIHQSKYHKSSSILKSDHRQYCLLSLFKTFVCDPIWTSLTSFLPFENTVMWWSWITWNPWKVAISGFHPSWPNSLIFIKCPSPLRYFHLSICLNPFSPFSAWVPCEDTWVLCLEVLG